MTGKTPLHMAAEMVSPDMVSVLLDHHADPNARTLDGVTPLHVLRGLTSEFLFEGVVSGLTHMDPNKLRLCLELVHSAVMVTTRDEGAAAAGGANFPMASHKIGKRGASSCEAIASGVHLIGKDESKEGGLGREHRGPSLGNMPISSRQSTRAELRIFMTFSEEPSIAQRHGTEDNIMTVSEEELALKEKLHLYLLPRRTQDPGVPHPLYRPTKNKLVPC
ncbi:hypothetical protein EJB05_00787 [Eragrostis curvula]|uniref:Uncharacterized protein n=1 Tax=Eragrostis curvula TaxID=38414 RepID=A0A5J9WQB1_9POAL|nr:hypothetical protein EJB05_00787 [Eragrostis curvula]